MKNQYKRFERVLPLNPDLLWLAGLLEGEGCFTVTGGGRGTPTVKVGMTDKDVVQRVAKLLGTKCLGPYGVSKHGRQYKDNYEASLHGQAALEFMRTVKPLMFLRRRTKIKELLAHKWYSYATAPRNARGHFVRAT
jgi:hypothetical protein